MNKYKGKALPLTFVYIAYFLGWAIIALVRSVHYFHQGDRSDTVLGIVYLVLCLFSSFSFALQVYGAVWFRQRAGASRQIATIE